MNNPLLTEAIGVYFLDMDTAVEEEVHPNEDGSFTIIINARISQARQMIAYCHRKVLPMYWVPERIN